MSTTLKDEIQQTRPFASIEQETYLNIIRTASLLQHEMGEMLRPYDITPTQYNVLRILRGAGEAGLCRNEIRDRLVAQVPDATRLIDRMVETGLVSRERDSKDRRRTTTRITQQGRTVLERIEAPLNEEHTRRLGHLSPQEHRTLTRLLETVRQRPQPQHHDSDNR